MSGKGFSRRVTKDNLEDFRALLRQAKVVIDIGGPTENGEEDEPPDPEIAKAEALFLGTPLKIRAPFAPPKRPQARGKGAAPKERKSAPPGVAKVSTTPTPPATRGSVLWRKKLAASDVQRQTGHPTGGVRLTQAGFKGVSGNVIDQTTYFRTVFANATWRQVKEHPYEEEAVVPVEVHVDGQSLGVHDLAINHKPSGEAGQGNYTDILKWKGLARTIQERNLTGKTLTLYEPPRGQTQPYIMEIG